MTTAASRAALARALRQAPGIKAMVGRYGKPNDVWWEREAAAILEAQPHLRLVSGGNSPYDDEATHDRESSAGTHLYDPMCGFCSAAEIDRLRNLLAFTLSVLRSGERLTPEEDGEIARAATG